MWKAETRPTCSVGRNRSPAIRQAQHAKLYDDILQACNGGTIDSPGFPPGKEFHFCVHGTPPRVARDGCCPFPRGSNPQPLDPESTNALTTRPRRLLFIGEEGGKGGGMGGVNCCVRGTRTAGASKTYSQRGSPWTHSTVYQYGLRSRGLLHSDDRAIVSAPVQFISPPPTHLFGWGPDSD